MKEREHSWVQEAWDRSREKVHRLGQRIGSAFPHATQQGSYVCEPPGWWTAGFWPGLLWLLYRDDRAEPWKLWAQGCEEQMDAALRDIYRLDHDLGFMWSLTSVAQYKLLGSEASRRRAVTAATLLLGRLNVKGGYIRAWNPWTEGEDNAGIAIIDCMMNLPLLHWASEVTGDPRFRHAAVMHADTVLQHFMRGDGSVSHIIRFDPETGGRQEELGGQGYAPGSAWARGTAWAMYGFALSYSYTGRKADLEASLRASNFFLAQLPEDGLPEWDFRLPEGALRAKDSSAAACAASALLELGRLLPAHEGGAAYGRQGAELVRRLYEQSAAWDRPSEEALLLHGTGHGPHRHNIDVSLIYGDYFFMEALAKLRGQTELFW
ncbi:glycosyl hydrolase [Paenibacillus sp. CAA11]|nr:glycosyl hydrolase [Paenibacillus sp. CAA11]